MRKIILTNGLIAGAIVSVLIHLTMQIGVHGGLLGMALGYLGMLVAFSFIYVGVKKYRDNELGGVIKFRHALMVGLGIAGIGSLIYIINWEVYMYFTNYTFMEEYAKSAIEGMRAKGMAAAEITKYQSQMATMAENYKQPIYRMLMTFAEIGPVGLVVSLVSAAMLRMPKGKGA